MSERSAYSYPTTRTRTVALKGGRETVATEYNTGIDAKGGTLQFFEDDAEGNEILKEDYASEEDRRVPTPYSKRFGPLLPDDEPRWYGD